MLASPILHMIYPNASDGGMLFAMVAPLVFFSAISQTIYGSLQGMGKIYIPALSVLLGGIVKLILNVILIPIPALNIYGAAIGSVVYQIVAFLVSYIVLIKNLPMKLSFTKYFIKPLVASLIMGGVVRGVYMLLLGMGNTVATLVSIVVGAGAYFAVVLAIGIFQKEELAKIPVIGKFFRK